MSIRTLEEMCVELSQGHVEVLGFKLYYRSFGRPDKGTVLGLHGGPGGTHDYLLPLADLAQFGHRVVLFDQIGCGRSERPQNSKYYTQSRAVDEVEGVRKALRLGRVHLLGSSYGGALALDVALRYPKGMRSLIIVSGFASDTLNSSEWNPHLPRGIRKTITKYGAKGDFKNPKYIAAQEVLYRTQACRLRVWPYDWCYSAEHHTHFNLRGLPDRLEGWDITDHLPEIRLPCLITAGKYDLVSPKCARAIHEGIRGSKLVMFDKGSHLPMWEDRVEFIEVVRDFLRGAKTR
jgi:proline iminopeptidase